METTIDNLANDMKNKLAITDSQPQERVPMYVSLDLDGDTTEKIKDMLIEECKKHNINHESYPTIRNMNDVCHVTLIFNKDLPTIEAYLEFIKNNYAHQLKKQVEVDIVGFAADQHCVAYMIKCNKIAYHPADKNMHITMMLNAKQPVYSNDLLKRLLEPGRTLADTERLVTFDKPILVNGTINYVGNVKPKKPETDQAQKTEKPKENNQKPKTQKQPKQQNAPKPQKPQQSQKSKKDDQLKQEKKTNQKSKTEVVKTSV